MVYAGRDPLTGRKRWVSRQVAGTGRAAFKEAKQIEAKLLAEVAAGRHQEAQGVKVAELVDRWLGWRQAVKPMSPGTAANYRRCIKLKIKPALGDLAVSRLDPATLDRFYTELRQRGSKCQHCYRRIRNGQPPMRPGEVFRLAFTGEERVHQTDCVQGIPMTASAIRDVHAVLSGALQEAVVWGWRTDNPARSATPSAQAKAEVAPPEARQAVRLIETATTEDPELGLFLMLAVMLGSRRGELCSLRWTDVDFDHGEVLIDSGVIYIPGLPLIDQDRTKNYTKRRVAVGPATLDLLRAHRVEQAKAALAAGVSLTPDAYVFSHQPDGSKPMGPDGVSHRFAKLAQRLGGTAGCTTCGTSWSPSSSPPAWTSARSPDVPATWTAAGRRSAPTRTSSTHRTATRPSYWKGCYSFLRRAPADRVPAWNPMPCRPGPRSTPLRCWPTSERAGSTFAGSLDKRSVSAGH
jgi:integrase